MIRLNDKELEIFSTGGPAANLRKSIEEFPRQEAEKSAKIAASDASGKASLADWDTVHLCRRAHHDDLDSYQKMIDSPSRRVCEVLHGENELGTIPRGKIDVWVSHERKGKGFLHVGMFAMLDEAGKETVRVLLAGDRAAPSGLRPQGGIKIGLTPPPTMGGDERRICKKSDALVCRCSQGVTPGLPRPMACLCVLSPGPFFGDMVAHDGAHQRGSKPVGGGNLAFIPIHGRADGRWFCCHCCHLAGLYREAQGGGRPVGP